MTEELHFFSNFFREYYILHQYGEKAQEKLSESDRDWAFAYSIILGLFSFGLVHFGCWISERCFKPADRTDENIEIEAEVANKRMYRGEGVSPKAQTVTTQTAV